MLLKRACASNISSALVLIYIGYLFCCVYLLALHIIKCLICLSPAEDTPSSARLFDVIVNGCIPVIISDELELPFEGILDYRKVCMHLYHVTDYIKNNI